MRRATMLVGGLLAVGSAAGLATEINSLSATWTSNGYVDWARNCARAQGASTDPCDWQSQPWTTTSGPIITVGSQQAVNSPSSNRYFDWVNNATNNPGEYAFQLNSVRLVSAEAVGTSSPATNNVNIGAGQGISAAWESSITGQASNMQDARVLIRNLSGGVYRSWNPTDTTLVATGLTGQWLDTYPGPAVPRATPIDKTYDSTLATAQRGVTTSTGGNRVRIQVYQDGASESEGPLAVLGNLQITFGIQTANLASSAPTVYARVGGGSATATVTATNNPVDPSSSGFRAAGVTMSALNTAYYSGSGATAATVEAKGTLSRDYSFSVPEFESYGTRSGTVTIGRGDAPADASLNVSINGQAVGPMAQASDWGGLPSEGEVYSDMPSIAPLYAVADATDSDGRPYRQFIMSNMTEPLPDGVPAALTDLRLRAHAAELGISLALVGGDGTLTPVPVDGVVGPIAAGAAVTLRLTLDPDLAPSCADPARGTWCGGLDMITDVRRASGTTTLVTGATVFRFVLTARRDGLPPPQIIAVVPGEETLRVLFEPPDTACEPLTYSLAADPHDASTSGDSSPLTLNGLTNGRRYDLALTAHCGGADSLSAIGAGTPWVPAPPGGTHLLTPRRAAARAWIWSPLWALPRGACLEGQRGWDGTALWVCAPGGHWLLLPGGTP